MFLLVTQSLCILIYISLLHDLTYPPPALTSQSHGPELPPSVFSSPHLHALSSRPKTLSELMSPEHSTPHIQGSLQSTSTTIVSVATGGLINRLQPCHYDNGTPTAPYTPTDSAHLPSFSIWTPFSLQPPPTPTPPGELGPVVYSGSLRSGKGRWSGGERESERAQGACHHGNCSPVHNQFVAMEIPRAHLGLRYWAVRF